VLLVARRAERLAALAGELRDARWLAVDLLEEGAPARIAAWAEEARSLELLVNNVGSSWRAVFGEEGGGHANVRRTRPSTSTRRCG